MIIVVVDYGMGNLRSMAQALRHVAPEVDVQISDQAEAIRQADRLVLPGQGAMQDCMASLHRSGLKDAIVETAREKPLLGVCVGQQMLLDVSEEGQQTTPCLGLLPGSVVRFRLEGRFQEDGSRFKVPHIGWNQVRQTVPHPLWQGIAQESHFYFVHSFVCVPKNPAHTVGETCYGDPFSSVIARDNIFATQFHPEKSGAAGLRLCRNFVDWKP